MGKNERRAYLEAVIERYQKAGKRAKTAILDEFCAVCNYNRKYATRLLNRQRKRSKKRPGRKPVYRSTELLRALKRIWLATDQMCSKRLVAAIPLWLSFYEKAYEKLSDEVRNKLQSVSAATIDRFAGSNPPQDSPQRPLCHQTGQPAAQSPIRTHNWDISQPGFMEADTVAHCGNSLAGDYIWSLTLTDIHTGWTECRATWNNGATGVIRQVKNIEAKLAFPLKGFVSLKNKKTLENLPSNT